jgi:AcrR family transcriptional regulator
VARLPQALQRTPVGRTRLSREELSERQLEVILAAATEVFGTRGFQAATVDSIVAAAGIGVGSFYAHFEGKDGCLAKVCLRISEEVHAAISADLREGDWAERLCDGLYALLRFVAAKPVAARVVLLEAQTGGAEILAQYSAMVDEIATFLAKGRAAGGDSTRPQSFEEATARGLCWLLQGRLLRRELDDVDALFAEMAEVALEPYLGVTAARRQIAAAVSRAD